MAITIQNLTVSYQRHPVVHHANGQFESGQLSAVFGPNGAGKSTFLKAIVGLVEIDQGAIKFDGFQRNEISYLPQRSEIDLTIPITVFELVSMGLWPKISWYKKVADEDKRSVYLALQQVGMLPFSNQTITTLSQGQLQRCLFARLIVENAQCIILDEPFNAIDQHTTNILLEIIHRWQSQNRTVIAVIHNMELIRDHFKQVVILSHEVIAWGDVKDTLTADNISRATSRSLSWASNDTICKYPSDN